MMNNNSDASYSTDRIGQQNSDTYEKTTAVDFVDKAEQVILNLKARDNGRIKLTTSKIRKFLTAVNNVKNKVDAYRMRSGSDVLSDELAMEVKFLKVNLLYLAGKEKSDKRNNNDSVENFVRESQMIERISQIGKNIESFEKFCKYVEALVAYHKYYGGKDS